MDLEKVLEQLRSELRNLDAAIVSLENLHLSARRRGRPPAWLAAVKNPGRPKRGATGPRGSTDGKKPE